MTLAAALFYHPLYFAGYNGWARMMRRVAVAALVSLSLISTGSSAAEAQKILVFAAASLRDALDEIALGYEQQSNVKVLLSYAASSALAKQIESGAPADIFVSADLDWMNYLDKKKLIDAKSRVNLVGNRLVLISGADAKLQPTIGVNVPMIDLLRSERIAIANPDHVPAGKYARAALEHLGVWASIQDKLVRTDNVRVALSLVSRGEVPTGIVYLSDAMADKQVRVVGEFAADSHPAIIYPATLVAESKNTSSPPFLNHLVSEQARAIFKKHGFIPL
ncbi:MAG TPA: molybdate ABC transporter substrate-binding protein [Burkholderiales bacterium]|nr:molybdate ABC transporter substrate-binding protein [Burkholderiales bacterium]